MSRLFFILTLSFIGFDGIGVLGFNAPLYANDTDARISDLEEQMQTLIGQVEELNHALKKIKTFPNDIVESETDARQEDTPKLSSKDEDQLTILSSDIEKNADLLPPSTQNLPLDDVQAQYDLAMAKLKQNSPQEAQQAFQNFIDQHQNKKQATTQKLVTNAHFWLGECLMAQNLLNEAASQFASCYQNYIKLQQKSSASKTNQQSMGKVPEALAKLAAALQKMKKTQEACATLKQLNQEFKHIPSSVKKMAERISHECKCPIEH